MIHIELEEYEARVVQQELESRVHYYYKRLKTNLTSGTRRNAERKLGIIRGLAKEIKRALD